MKQQALSKLSKKMKIAAGVVEMLFGMFAILFGIYIFDGHIAKLILAASLLWLVGLFTTGVGIKLIYESRSAA